MYKIYQQLVSKQINQIKFLSLIINFLCLLQIYLYLHYNDQNIKIDIENDSDLISNLQKQVQNITGIEIDKQFLITEKYDGILDQKCDIEKLQLENGDIIEVYGTNNVFDPAQLKIQGDDDQGLIDEIEPYGLPNPNNFCYLNAAIQCLNYMPKVQKLILEKDFQSILLKGLQYLMKQLQQQVPSTQQFIQVFVQACKQFDNISQQHDSQEALDCIENKLLEYSKDNLINFQTEKSVKSNFIEINFMSGIQNLEDGISEYIQENGRLLQCPEYLQFHLQRFTIDEETKTVQKILRRIEIGFDLDIKKYVTNPIENITEYKLKSIIAHKGLSATSGHYVCFTRINGTWWLLNDQDVEQVTQRQIKLTFGGSGESFIAYVLVYQKVEK